MRGRRGGGQVFTIQKKGQVFSIALQRFFPPNKTKKKFHTKKGKSDLTAATLG
jgi:hypothetical protein